MPKLGFSPSSYSESESEPEAKGFSLIEPGWYSAELISVEEKAYKSGLGGGLQFTWVILGPRSLRRRVWDTQTTYHTSERALARGRAHVAALLRACGAQADAEFDMDELLGRTVEIKVKVDPGNGQWPARNVVDGYREAGQGAYLTNAGPVSDASAPAMEQHAAAFDDDDIPF
jgi:hypothetical protein